jgi:hypothetical protein
MKKIPALVLLTILLVNTTGFYVYYVIALQRIHKEMRGKLRTLPDEKLSRLVLLRDTYEASLVEDDEIKLNGKMYDIARSTLGKDSVILYAMHDEKEENFLTFANEIISKPFKQDSAVTGSVLHFIALVFLPGQQIATTHSDDGTVAHQSNYTFSLNAFSLQHEAPPPRTMA